MIYARLLEIEVFYHLTVCKEMIYLIKLLVIHTIFYGTCIAVICAAT